MTRPQLPAHILTVDFETYYGDDYTLSKMTTEAYVRDARFEPILVGCKLDTGRAEWFTPEDFASQVVSSVDWQNTAANAHHAHFDGLILAHHYDVRPAFWFDTLSMARALHGTEVGNSLAKLLPWYGLGEKGHEVNDAKGKHRADFTPAEFAAYGAYCCNDVEGGFDLLCRMLTSFPEDELHLIDTTVRMFTEPRLRVNRDKLGVFLLDERARKAALLDRVGAHKKEVGSNEKLAEIFRLLGEDPPTKPSPATGLPIYAFAKSDPGMQELLDSPVDAVRWVAEARVAVKSTTNETRTERLLGAGTRGPLPIYLKYYGAHTGRWSGGDKMNPQNFVRGGVIRDALEAPAGSAVVVVDSSQIEARVLAWLAGDAGLVQAFAEGRDIYCEDATGYYGRTITPADKQERFVGKFTRLGLGFGMGWAKAAQSLARGALGNAPVQFTQRDVDAMAVSVAQFERQHGERARGIVTRMTPDAWMIHCAVAHAVVTRYRDANQPVVRLWAAMEDLLSAVMRDKRVELGPVSTTRDGILLPNGMTLRYPDLQLDDDGFTYHGNRKREKAYGGLVTENVVQALARIVVGEQMLALQWQHGYRAALMTHDEVALIVPESEAPLALERARAAFAVAPVWAAGLPLSSSGGFASSYGGVEK